MKKLYIRGEALGLVKLYEQMLEHSFKEYDIEREDLVLTLSYKDQIEESFLTFVADSVIGYIINVVEHKMIHDVIYYEYGDVFGEDEQKLIAKTHQVLHGEDYYEELKIELMSVLKRETKTTHNFDVSGFLTFRLRKRTLHVYDTVLSITESYLLAEDENDGNDIQFAQMLARFVMIQIPKINKLDLIHIDGTYEVVIEGNTRVDKQGLEDLLIELNAKNSRELTHEDIILSTILTLAPREITIHVPSGYTTPLCEMLQVAYEGRVDLCYACDLCHMFYYED